MQPDPSETAELSEPTNVPLSAGVFAGPSLVETQSTYTAEPFEAELVGAGLIQKVAGAQSEPRRKRSSRNAITHGIFSSVTVLPSESRRVYQSLQKELQESLNPVGGAEELLVEKLASIAWRQRRLLAAESAEIRRSSELYAWDQKKKVSDDAQEKISRAERYYDSLISRIENPLILKRCLILLSKLRCQIQARGFVVDTDMKLLREIYGCEMETTLCQTYRAAAKAARAPREELQAQAI